MTCSDLTDRQKRMVDEYRAELPQGQPAAFYEGMLTGYKTAVRTMWADVDEFWRTDPTASALTLKALAIEQMLASK